MTLFADLTLRYSGKVRDVYEFGDDLVLVASDRLSAFDVVLAEPVPDKGRVLTALSAFWFDHLPAGIHSHLVTTDVTTRIADAVEHDLVGRSMWVRRADMLPIECIVRGYISGSAWKEYQRTGTIHGEAAPSGLIEGSALPEPRFTPSTKSAAGHDLNISNDEASELVGAATLRRAQDICLTVFREASLRVAQRGLILADTKFELGVVDGELVIADEMLTPDSSRYWLASQHAPGSTPVSFDKQPVRDYLDGLDWDKSPPPPPMPAEVIGSTRERYIDAYERITGLSFSDWPGAVFNQ